MKLRKHNAWEALHNNNCNMQSTIIEISLAENMQNDDAKPLRTVNTNRNDSHRCDILTDYKMEACSFNH